MGAGDAGECACGDARAADGEGQVGVFDVREAFAAGDAVLA